MKRSVAKKNIFVVCLIMLLVGAIVLFFYCKRKTVKISTPETASEIIQTDTSTNSWKIYKHSDVASFSIRYPGTWYYTDNNPNFSAGVPNIVFSPNKIPNVYSRNYPCLAVYAGIWDSMDNIIFEESGHKIISSKNILVNGMSGFWREIINEGNEPMTYQVLLQGDKNTTYSDKEWTFYILESCPGTDGNTFRKMISTFNRN